MKHPPSLWITAKVYVEALVHKTHCHWSPVVVLLPLIPAVVTSRLASRRELRRRSG
eukprot:SAG31_NODE_23519_length_502_cov_1.287841_1_plen_55_part_10